MLNKDGERELAYLVNISDIQPIVGSDNCEAAYVNNWHVMVRKNTYKIGDIAIYFEIDSKLDELNPAFSFVDKKHYKVKTQRYTFGGKGNFISQGLLMSINDFGWNSYPNGIIMCGNQELHIGDGVTKLLNITYIEEEDNYRKSKSVDKYKSMANRNQKLFKKYPFRFLMRYELGRKILFLFFGKKKDSKSSWPVWVKKTDEERVQSLPQDIWNQLHKERWIVTEKIDGTSTTFTMRRHKSRFIKKESLEYLVCSRNVVFDKPDKDCFYDSNVYIEMSDKYRVERCLKDILLNNPDLEWVTLQGETFGDGIQKRTYHVEGHSLAAFNFIDSKRGRWNSVEAKNLIMGDYGIPWVPILDESFELPETVDELLEYATSDSKMDDGMREGVVLRSLDGVKSFKAVSNEYLMKYHG